MSRYLKILNDIIVYALLNLKNKILTVKWRGSILGLLINLELCLGNGTNIIWSYVNSRHYIGYFSLIYIIYVNNAKIIVAASIPM